MKTSPDKKTLPLLILLALICIGSVELAVCRYYNPALYHSITDPVINGVTGAVSAICTTATDAASDISNGIRTTIQDARARAEAHRAAEALKKAQQEILNPPEPEDTPTPVSDADDQTSTQPLLITSAPVCDPSVTQLQQLDGQDVLTGGPINVVYYSQNDPRWCDLKYGSDRIGTHGCGPTAMAIVVNSLSDTVIDPPAMAQWAADHGYWARRSGSYHSIVIGTAAGFGLTAETFPSREIIDLQDALLSGKLLVALMGPGHFTQSGHFIVLRGVTLSGEILVADPSSPDRTLTAWDAQLILDELSKSTADGSPLWVISSSDSSLFE